AYLEHHAAGVVFGARHSLVAVVRRWRCAHQHPVLSPPGNGALATGSLGLVFIAINLYQITRIYLERRPVVLSEDERKLYDLGFRSLRQREFVALALAGEWKSAEAGERVVTEGESVSGLCISITGSAEVHKQSDRIGTLGPGHIIGTSLALTGAPSPVEIVFTEPA